ncbi:MULTISPECIES: carboxypeptidase-like regulatory domain-containing protein [unclassified Schlesneria]|uniref:carboxypeptidase-like regulatory domain-containing protein n=2 Tax=Planctomycetaceae TaxID=126 RepID=UPI0035A0F929
MFGIRFVKGMAVSLAAFGMMVPQTRLLADTPAAKAPVAKAGKVNRVPDLVLTAGGTMTGRVCDHSGKVIEGAKVVLKQNNKEIAQTVTNNEGTYSFKNLKSGIYQVGSGNTDGVFRVWSEKTAPPSAKEHALLVMGENGARGQFGAVDPTLVLLTGGVIAAVVLSAIAVSEINSVKDTVNQIPISP